MRNSMNYLRGFNEGVNHEDIKDFCEMSLAYLLDEGVTVNVTKYNAEEDVVIIYLHESMTWSECKDHVIPFLTRVVNKYELAQFSKDRSFLFSVKTDKGRIGVAVSVDEIKDIDQIMTEYPLKFSAAHKKTGFDFIMDEILFYVKNEK